jgi:hypothetical protein
MVSSPLAVCAKGAGASTVALAVAKKTKEANPQLAGIRTVYVKGNNETAVKAREKLTQWTCFESAPNAKDADAVLEFSQQQGVSGSVFSSNRERSIVSAELGEKESPAVEAQVLRGYLLAGATGAFWKPPLRPGQGYRDSLKPNHWRP